MATLPSSKSGLKALAKTLTVQELRFASQVFTEVADGVEQRERLSEIKALKKRLAEVGLTPADLMKGDRKPGRVSRKVAKSAPKAKKPSLPAKYAMMVDGVEVTWSGRGRPPAPIQQFLKSGGSRDDLLLASPIKKTAAKSAPKAKNKAPTKVKAGARSKRA